MIEEQQLSCTNEGLTTEDETSKPPTSDRDDEEENDQEIIRSILSDGHYEISSEDRSILESVVANLDTVSQ